MRQEKRAGVDHEPLQSPLPDNRQSAFRMRVFSCRSAAGRPGHVSGEEHEESGVIPESVRILQRVFLQNFRISQPFFHSLKGVSPEASTQTLRSKRRKGAQQSILRCAPFCIGLSALLRAVGCCRLRKQLGFLDKPDELSPIAFSIYAFRCAGTL